jgi:hypothetical protein
MATLTIEEGLIYKLLNTAGVSNLVGTRVYGLRIPQGATMPCVVITRVSTPRLITHDTSGSTGTAHPRIQIDAWGSLQATVKPITDAIRAALNGYSGTITSGANSVIVQAAYVDGETIEYDAEIELYRSRSEYIVWHQE